MEIDAIKIKGISLPRVFDISCTYANKFSWFFSFKNFMLKLIFWMLWYSYHSFISCFKLSSLFWKRIHWKVCATLFIQIVLKHNGITNHVCQTFQRFCKILTSLLAAVFVSVLPSSLPTNVCWTELNIPFPKLTNQSLASIFRWLVSVPWHLSGFDF